MSKSKVKKEKHISKKWLQRLRFLPCFFDVPVKYVHIILNVSHHTLDPMRRAFNLDRWPYGEVMKGKFYMTLEEIAELRTSMMASADEPMREILSRMAVCAEECKERNEPPPPREPREMMSNPPPSPDITDQQAEAVWPDSEDNQEFRDDISRIFELREELAGEPARPD